MSLDLDRQRYVLYKDAQVLAEYLDEVIPYIWEGEAIPHQLGFASMYNDILERAQELYPDDTVVMSLFPVPLEETPEQFTLMKNIHLLRNHIEAEQLTTKLRRVQGELDEAQVKLRRLHAIA